MMFMGGKEEQNWIQFQSESQERFIFVFIYGT